ncbi:hypothetical protein E2C01_002990 [Portunus trituberculatus]|uniref:Uncharacterized protein n=1 Tax=Portunus trituberculatus TaxID=210409 RepID=A0A5B7CPN2_PORTR|nr:hypothetical protein [Portunus trituberculatus]
MPLTILYTLLLGPLVLFYLVRSFSSGTICVVIFCIFSYLLISFLELRDHTTAAYSSFGRIMLVMIFFIISLSMY